MSTVTPGCLVQGVLAQNTDVVIYTVPAGKKALIDQMSAANTDASTRTLTVNVVPSGGSVSAANQVTPGASIAANTAVSLSEMKSQILEAGDFISIKASAADLIAVRISGRLVS